MTDSVLITSTLEVHLTLKKGSSQKGCRFFLSYLFPLLLSPTPPFFGFRHREQCDPLEVGDAQICTP